jgi:uncharacterized membrane protein YfcA
MPEIWIGLAGGLLIGATGTGAGSLMTPLLILAGVRPAIAVGTTLALLAASKTTGSLVHGRLGHWPGRDAWILVAGGAVGVAAAWIPAQNLLAASAEPWTRRMMAVMLLGIAAATAFQHSGVHLDRPRPDTAPRPAALVAAGGAVAAVMTLTSAGSGGLLVPLLLLTTPWSPRQLAAASNVFGCVAGVLGVVVHLGLGHFDSRTFAAVLLGVLPGVVAGALLSRRISRPTLALGMAVLAAALGIRLLH